MTSQEHDSHHQLPISPQLLGSLAENSHAYAKALHYKEIEFRTSPAAAIAALISINNRLQHPEAAIGILRYAQITQDIELKESWYEKLGRWEDALSVYERKQQEDPTNPAFTAGRIRCLDALGEWKRLNRLAREKWRSLDTVTRKEAAPHCAEACWHVGNWDFITDYVGEIDEGTVPGLFFRTILSIHNEDFVAARAFIEKTRNLSDTELTALVGESYTRAYNVVVRLQQLAELEEVIEYKEVCYSLNSVHA